MFLFPLFYVIREFHRFLHRGKAGIWVLIDGRQETIQSMLLVSNDRGESTVTESFVV